MEMINNRIFLTFDIDWAGDEAIQFVLDKLEEYSCKATFFVTHESALINKMKKTHQVELGLHPNFNKILFAEQSNQNTNIETILKDVKNIVPDAVCVRSHCLTQGTLFMQLFKKYNLLIDCNSYIPFFQLPDANITPWRFWTDTLVVPFVWSDYIDALQMGNIDLKRLLKTKSVIKVVAFHPIHIFLNNSNVEDYRKYKESNLSAKEYKKLNRQDRYGIGDIFNDFLQGIVGNNIKTNLIKDILDMKGPLV